MPSLPTSFKLNNGLSIPSVGLGTWQSPKGQVRDAVCAALKAGYRHIDCAWGYQNEGEVGEGIRLSGVPREEIWITSKVRSQRAHGGPWQREPWHASARANLLPITH